MSKPKGSGYFATAIGAVLAFTFVMSFIFNLKSISPYVLLQGWLLFAGVILLGWGINRVANSIDDWTVGQETINFVVAVVGATIAIFTLVAQTPDAPKSSNPQGTATSEQTK